MMTYDEMKYDLRILENKQRMVKDVIKVLQSQNPSDLSLVKDLMKIRLKNETTINYLLNCIYYAKLNRKMHYKLNKIRVILGKEWVCLD